MEYLNAITERFGEIVAQVNGQIVVERDGNTMISCLFPNFRLKTASGKPFNVMGVLQLADGAGNIQNTVMMVYEPSMAMLLDPDNCPFDQMGTLFIVGGRGRIYDKKTEIGILQNFMVLKDIYHEKYHSIPGFPLFLSTEQAMLLNQ